MKSNVKSDTFARLDALEDQHAEVLAKAADLQKLMDGLDAKIDQMRAFQRMHVSARTC